MTPEMYLMQVKDIDLRIRSLQGELKDAENENDEGYADYLRKKIGTEVEQYTKTKIKIHDEIMQIKDNKLGTLLSEYYLRGKSWEQVTHAIGHSDPKWVRTRLREKALKLFAANFPEYFLL